MTENTGPELLAAWIEDGGRKIGWVAKQVHVDRSTLAVWLRGGALPQPVYRKSIAVLTDGAVPVESWING